MASVRKIVIGDSTLEWNTGLVRSLYYNPNDVEKMYQSVIKPNLKISNEQDIRSSVKSLVESKLKYFRMHQFCSFITALRETQIDTSRRDENGNFVVGRLVYNDISYHYKYERITYYNVAFHMNRHCRQLYRCCFIRVTDGKFSTNLCYTDGEFRDNNDVEFLDTIDEFAIDKENKRKAIANKYNRGVA